MYVRVVMAKVEYMQNGNLFFFVVTFICDRIDLTRFRASCRKNISWKF